MLLGIIASGSKELPDGFDEKTSIARSKEFIKKINCRDFDWCYDCFSALMKSSMDKQRLTDNVNAVLDGLGDFQGFKSASVYPKKSLGVDYALCTVKCRYENGSATFDVAIDKDMNVGGLHIR